MLHGMEHGGRKSYHALGNGPVLAIFEVGNVYSSLHFFLHPSDTFWVRLGLPIQIHNELSSCNCRISLLPCPTSTPHPYFL